jgi:hypothetical protein
VANGVVGDNVVDMRPVFDRGEGIDPVFRQVSEVGVLMLCYL